MESQTLGDTLTPQTSDVQAKKQREKTSVENASRKKQPDKRLPTRKPALKKKWSDEELDALKKYFINHLHSTTLPGKALFEKCQENFPILADRTWRNLKDRLRQLQSTNTKNKA